MNLQTVTLQDCLERYEKNGEWVVLNDGKVVCFGKYRKRKIPTQTANPSGDE